MRSSMEGCSLMGYCFPCDSYELEFIFGLNEDLDITVVNEDSNAIVDIFIFFFLLVCQSFRNPFYQNPLVQKIVRKTFN